MMHAKSDTGASCTRHDDTRTIAIASLRQALVEALRLQCQMLFGHALLQPGKLQPLLAAGLRDQMPVHMALHELRSNTSTARFKTNINAYGLSKMKRT